MDISLDLGFFGTKSYFSKYKRNLKIFLDENGCLLENFSRDAYLEEEVHQELAELKDILTESEYNDLFHEQLNYKKKELADLRFMAA